MISDEFRELASDLFTQFDAPTVTVERPVRRQSFHHQRTSGTVDDVEPDVSTVRALFGTRKRRLEDGTIKTEITGTFDGEVKIGDRIKHACNSFTVLDVTEINPDLSGAIVFKAVLQ